MAGVPYEAGPYEFLTTGNDPECFEINIPHRAVIQAIRFTQLSGSEADCDLEIFNKRVACPVAGETSESSSQSAVPYGSSEAGFTASALHSIFGVKTRTAGVALIEVDKCYPYVNKDGTPTNGIRKLHVQLTPTGAPGERTWGLSLALETGIL